ncbi:MerR family transcriptional regulator [Rugosimonospora acidiphila]|uniref:MerR family transcriptional regulator n=1 Tax=Rugosimonospora acidiphila TaxID=556531 RepID=A0ABP9SCL9_9ACTN
MKTLRYYHRVGLLEPADVDAHSNYRRYTVEQIPTAQIIRRFRELDMPVDEIQKVLATPDVGVRNELIGRHLARLEEGLARTQAAVESLHNLLRPAAQPPIHRRRVEATAVAAITETLDIADALPWFQGALGELRATVNAQKLTVTGPAGGVFADELFTDERGQATIFLPCTGEVRRVGRVASLTIPAIELAVIEHTGPLTHIDSAYAALATYVSRHALAVDGPLREYYPVSILDTPDESLWRTEIGWPIFNTTA